jgi:uncharacterized lipoprotein YehR (DUF1307 family)
MKVDVFDVATGEPVTVFTQEEAQKHFAHVAVPFRGMAGLSEFQITGIRVYIDLTQKSGETVQRIEFIADRCRVKN